MNLSKRFPNKNMTDNKADCEKASLECLKENYSEIQEKYGLSSFDELNEDFQIEKLSEAETDFLIREIRKFITEKFSNYLRFIETILNPVNAQFFVFSVIKTLGTAEKEKFNEIYKKLAKKEVEVIELDIQFSEEKEAEFVKSSCELWKSLKTDLLEIVDVIKKNWDVKLESNGKRYFD